MWSLVFFILYFIEVYLHNGWSNCSSLQILIIKSIHAVRNQVCLKAIFCCGASWIMNNPSCLLVSHNSFFVVWFSFFCRSFSSLYVYVSFAHYRRRVEIQSLCYFFLILLQPWQAFEVCIYGYFSSFVRLCLPFAYCRGCVEIHSICQHSINQ